MLRKKWYVNNKKNIGKCLEEGYEMCPFNLSPSLKHYKYILLTKDGYITFSDLKGE